MVLKDSQLSAEERRTFLEVSLRNTANLKRLVEELFELAKLDARQVQLRPEPLQIAELAQDVALKLAPEAQGAGVSLTVEPGGDLPLVTGDVGMIERVLTNLMENALRFTPAGGAVRAILAGEARAVRVTVADTGMGILPEDLPHIFERFYRADKSRDRATGGAGLGLAIARQIVELHGSALEVHSRPGEGARFSFVLPASSTGSAPGA
jgi:signal transduction histidine kinase